MPSISAAGNTLVPAILALEALGFKVRMKSYEDFDLCEASRGDETYVADDPMTVLGLIKLIEVRTWEWEATDEQIGEMLLRYEI